MKYLSIVFCLLALNPVFGQTSLNSAFELSVQALKEGDWHTGLEVTSKLLKSYPENENLHYNKGLALFQLGDMEGACGSFTEANRLGFKVNKGLLNYYCNEDYKYDLLKKHFYTKVPLDPENSYRPYYTRKDTLRGALRPERTCFDVTYYKLQIRILPPSRSIRGYNEIHFKILNPSRRIQLDLFENMVIDSIVYGKKKLSFSREYDAVWVDFANELKLASTHKIRVYYHGKPRIAPKPPWDGGFVWKRDSLLNYFVGVACEQLGASVWWPTKDHLSDRPDSMAIHIEVPDKYQAVCNGTLRNVVYAGDGYTRYEWFVQYPINNYNATFYMGRFAEFTDTILSLNDTLVARYHVLPQNLELAKSHFGQAREVIDFYNRAFGPFPFWQDNFRMVEAPFEGMEHQTAIAYGNAYSNEKNATAYLNKSYDYIIVHEAAHEWWGNSVTAGDMADAWIHEGFATYAEYLFLEEKLGYAEAEKELQHHMLNIFNFWPMVQNRNVNEDAFAGGDIYVKGAAVLHSLRATLHNDSLFKALLKDFYASQSGKIVNTETFIQFVNQYTQDDYSAFFAKFLYETELPILHYSYKRTEQGLLLNYCWKGVAPGFKMAFGIYTPTGKQMRLLGTSETQELMLEGERTFNFYTILSNLSLAPKNAFTYYYTKCEN